MALAGDVLDEGEEFVAEIKVEHKQQFGSQRIGSILVSDRRVVFSYRSGESWETFSDHELTSTPFAQYRNGERHAIFIPEPDAETVSQLESEYIEKVEAETGTTHFLEIIEEASDDPPVDPSACTCERISSNNVLVEDENMELDEYFDANEFRFVSCKDCYQIYGRYRRGKKASLKKLFSADWLLGGDLSPTSIVEFGEDDAFALHLDPGASICVQDAVLTLSHIAERSVDVISTYKFEYQHVLCYIDGDEMAAYLMWEDHERGPILSQLYVREEYRGEGIAADLVSYWYEQVCESDHYFADELTEGGRRVLSSTGHLDGEPATAREVLSLTSMGFA